MEKNYSLFYQPLLYIFRAWSLVFSPKIIKLI